MIQKLPVRALPTSEHIALFYETVNALIGAVTSLEAKVHLLENQQVKAEVKAEQKTTGQLPVRPLPVAPLPAWKKKHQ